MKLINIITYELVRFDGKELFEREFDLVILDEAQRIKNWRTKTANMVEATEALILAIQELVDLGREHAVKEGLQSDGRVLFSQSILLDLGCLFS